MINMDEVGHALALLKDNPLLPLGIHLVLTAGRPVCPNVPSLADEQGFFRDQRQWMAYAEPRDIKKELECQVEKLLAHGVAPTHIDSHHHVHMHEMVLPIVLELAQRLKVPVRLGRQDVYKYDPHGKIKRADCFSDYFYGEGLTRGAILDILDANAACRALEIMCHPAYVDEKLMKASRYNLQRARELTVLTDPVLKEEIRARGIELISYKDL